MCSTFLLYWVQLCFTFTPFPALFGVGPPRDPACKLARRVAMLLTIYDITFAVAVCCSCRDLTAGLVAVPPVAETFCVAMMVTISYALSTVVSSSVT